MLDEAGLTDTKIVASNDLDEHTIASLREQGARIDIWGVGTKLDTCFDQPALGAVYKLTAFCDPDGGWRYPVKLSEHSAKISIPGVLGVRRFADAHRPLPGRHDLRRGSAASRPTAGVIVDPADALHMRAIEPDWRAEELVLPVLRRGKRVAPAPDLDSIRARARAQLDSLHPAIRRLLNPHTYPVGLERRLHDRRVAQVLRQAAAARSTTLTIRSPCSPARAGPASSGRRSRLATARDGSGREPRRRAASPAGPSSARPLARSISSSSSTSAIGLRQRLLDRRSSDGSSSAARTIRRRVERLLDRLLDRLRRSRSPDGRVEVRRRPGRVEGQVQQSRPAALEGLPQCRLELLVGAHRTSPEPRTRRRRRRSRSVRAGCPGPCRRARLLVPPDRAVAAVVEDHDDRRGLARGRRSPARPSSWRSRRRRPGPPPGGPAGPASPRSPPAGRSPWGRPSSRGTCRACGSGNRAPPTCRSRRHRS